MSMPGLRVVEDRPMGARTSLTAPSSLGSTFNKGRTTMAVERVGMKSRARRWKEEDLMMALWFN